MVALVALAALAADIRPRELVLLHRSFSFRLL
jgi:hypothetical protein